MSGLVVTIGTANDLELTMAARRLGNQSDVTRFRPCLSSYGFKYFNMQIPIVQMYCEALVTVVSDIKAK